MNLVTTRFPVVATALLLSTFPLSAASLGNVCGGNLKLSPGQWAKYATDAPFMRDKVESRYAIVGSEVSDGTKHFWFEMDFLTPGTRTSMIMQLLVASYPYDQDGIKRIIAKMSPEMQAMEMPVAAAASFARDNASDPLRLACEEAEKGVRELVTVPAGTFNALRVPVKILAQDVWISDEVPFGVVKWADSDDKGLELVAYGSDALSSITEEPQKMPGGS